MLGHADIATTAAHYLEAKEKPIIGLGNFLKIPENVISIEAAQEGSDQVLESRDVISSPSVLK
jgi:cobalamin biosynthesis protein CbiG